MMTRDGTLTDAGFLIPTTLVSFALVLFGALGTRSPSLPLSFPLV